MMLWVVAAAFFCFFLVRQGHCTTIVCLQLHVSSVSNTRLLTCKRILRIKLPKLGLQSIVFLGHTNNDHCCSVLHISSGHCECSTFLLQKQLTSYTGHPVKNIQSALQQAGVYAGHYAGHIFHIYRCGYIGSGSRLSNHQDLW